MSIRVMTAVWERAPYRGGALIVLLALADWADDAGYCFPAIPSIAKKSRLTIRQVSNLLKKFKKDGAVSIEAGGGRGSSNRYLINLEKLSMKSVSWKNATQSEKSEFKKPEIHDVAIRKNRQEPPQEPKREGYGYKPQPKSSVSVVRETVQENTAEGLYDQVQTIGHLYPSNFHLPNGRAIPRIHEEVIAEAIIRDGYNVVITGTRNLHDAVANWPANDRRFIPNVIDFYRNSSYLKDPREWDRNGDLQRRRSGQYPTSRRVKGVDLDELYGNEDVNG